LLNIVQLPLLLLFQSSSASLGSFTVYHTSIQGLVYAFRNLVTTTQMAFQGIFLMSAFTASMKLKPVLNPKHEDMIPFTPVHGGVAISAKYALPFIA